MDTKKSLRRSGRTVGLLTIGHQLLFQALSLVLVLAIGIGIELTGLRQFENTVLYIASDIAMLVSAVVFLVFYFVKRKTLKESSPSKSSFSLAGFLKCIIMILCANFILSALDIVFTHFTGLTLSPGSESLSGTDSLFLLITVAVFPAVTEELIFRGVIYRYLRPHGCVFAAIASSLVFGLIHMNFLQAFFAFFMGLVLCYAYERSGRLIFPMALHFANNALMVLPTALSAEVSALKLAECIFGAAALILVIGFVIYRKARGERLFSFGENAVGQKLMYFLTSIPMALTVIICIAVCAVMVFI